MALNQRNRPGRTQKDYLPCMVTPELFQAASWARVALLWLQVRMTVIDRGKLVKYIGCVYDRLGQRLRLSILYI